MEFGVAGVAAITAICYLVGQVVKASGLDSRYIPAIAGDMRRGAGRGRLYLGMPDFPAADPLTAAAVGIVSGLAATGAHQAAKQLRQ